MELTLGSNEYRTGKIGTIQQLHVVRRMLPIFTDIAAAAQSDEGKSIAAAVLATDDKEKREELNNDLLVLASPLIAKTLQLMSNDDVDYILDVCLSVCSRRNKNGTWAPVWRNSRLMFEDLELAELMQIVQATIGENLGSFFQPGGTEALKNGTTAG